MSRLDEYAGASSGQGMEHIADMRIEVVKRELNQGALAGFDSSVTTYAAQLVIAALDSFDEEALKAEFRRGFELGEENARLVAESVTQRSQGQPAPRADNQDCAATAVERTDMSGVTDRA